MQQITQELLTELTGYSRPAEIALCLDKQGVRYFTGKRGRIWTTQEAVNFAMGLPVTSPRSLEPEEHIAIIEY